MTQARKVTAKIGSRRARTAETFVDLGPGEPALTEWAALGLSLPHLETMREYRLNRVREQLREREYAGLLVADPLNVRYVTDCPNMQIWCMHNYVRYAFVAIEGPVVLFDFHGSAHLSADLPLVTETRPGVGVYYMGAGPRLREQGERWAREIAELVREHGGGNQRLALDHAPEFALDALRGHGIRTENGWEVMEQARAIKSTDELAAMRCAIAGCEQSMAVMREHLVPGVSENRLWAHLHAENIARGGEWIETRLLASGPRTNPWFAECSSRPIESGDIVAFDTDLIGAYGYCCDISRSWICGEERPTPEQHDLYSLALEQLQTNTALLRPGVSFRELTEQAMTVPDDCRANRYATVYHGVGLCDEHPAIGYREDWEASGYDGVLEPNMVLCVESYIGRVGGREGVKLEEQVLITDTGHEVLSRYPIESPFGQ